MVLIIIIVVNRAELVMMIIILNCNKRLLFVFIWTSRRALSSHSTPYQAVLNGIDHYNCLQQGRVGDDNPINRKQKSTQKLRKNPSWFLHIFPAWFLPIFPTCHLVDKNSCFVWSRPACNTSEVERLRIEARKETTKSSHFRQPAILSCLLRTFLTIWICY